MKKQVRNTWRDLATEPMLRCCRIKMGDQQHMPYKPVIERRLRLLLEKGHHEMARTAGLVLEPALDKPPF